MGFTQLGSSLMEGWNVPRNFMYVDGRYVAWTIAEKRGLRGPWASDCEGS